MPHTKDSNEETKVINNTEINKRREKKKNNKKRIIVICAVGVAILSLVLFFAFGGYEKILDFLGIERDVAVTPTIVSVEAEIKGEVTLAGIGGTTVLYDEKGFAGYGTDGKWKWKEEKSLSNPYVFDCGDFTVVADIGGTAVYAFNKDGLAWRYGNQAKIKSVFGKGKYVCIIHEEKEYLSAATVYEYDSKTATLKEKFTRKFSSYYMLTGAISNDSKQLVLSGVCSDGGVVSGVVSFLRMSDGEIFTNSKTENNAYVKVFYTSDNKVFAVNSDSVKIIYKSMSVSNEEDFEQILWSRDGKQNKIIDATLVDGKYCVAAIGNEETGKNIIKGFDEAGKECLNFEIEGNIIGVDSVGETFMVYTEKHVHLYNTRGFLIGKAEAGFKISGAVCADSRHVGVSGEGKLLTVSFK